MAAEQTLSASLEDYMEAIFHLMEKKGAARSKDIAKRLRVKRSSVTGALRSLAEKGLVNYAPYDLVTFTPRGKEIAESVVMRHNALRGFLTEVLHLDGKVADDAACKLEHAVKGEVMERLVSFVEFAKNCPRTGIEWFKNFDKFCRDKDLSENSEKRIPKALEELKQQEAVKEERT